MKELIIDNEKTGIPFLPCTPLLLTAILKKVVSGNLL